MKKKLLFLFTLLITHFGFAQLGFEENVVFDFSIDGTFEVFPVDIDNDGDMDVLSVSILDSKVALYKNLDGQGFFSGPQIISAPGDGVAANSVSAEDLDGDGDMDVVVSFRNDGNIVWYENIDGQGTFGSRQIISTIENFVNGITINDLDGDGDMDVLSAFKNSNKIAWYENTDGQGSFGPQRVITTIAWGASAAYAADLDGDGDLDVLASSRSDNRIAWFENTDGQGTFGAQQTITTNANAARFVYASDIDGDGDMDALSASFNDDKIAWYENIDGQGTFGTQQVITTMANYARWVYSSDIDGDGDMDVLSASRLDNKIAWYENMDGQGTFGAQQIISTLANEPYCAYTSDIDGDGDLDVISGSFADDTVAWYENTDGQGSFGAQQPLTPLINAPVSVYSSDMDGDNDMDILITSSVDNRISWCENTDGQGSFSRPHTITTDLVIAESAFASDLDGDGDMDVLSASSTDEKIAWYENIDGQGTFSDQQIITTTAYGARSVYASDIDGDGDMDVLSASRDDSKIAWYENTDSQGTFGAQQIITTSAYGANSTCAADLDGDGDMDVLSASINDDKIAWYENMDGQGTFGAQQVLTTSANFAFSVSASDLDGDGDMDVLSLSISDNKIAWYENTDGQGTFSTEQIITTSANGVESIYISDLDGDNDMDIVSASLNEKITWYENTDGQGAFGVEQIVTTNINNPKCVFVSDVDGDGSEDVISGSLTDDSLVWYKNLGTVTNEIIGEIKVDVNSNGCDNGDLPLENILVETTDGTVSRSTFSTNSGVYQLFPNSGNFTTSVVSPIPNYYTLNPASAVSNFTGVANTDTVDFCLVPSGVYNDLNITIYPNIDDPRPGFDTTYQIVYNNAGNTQLDGSIIFEFDNTKMQFLNASETVASQLGNILTFNFTDLNPFETRTIDLQFNVFPPPTTNINDILSFSGIIIPINNDETPSDNEFKLEQIVIGSYDPNDIRVLEGDQILLEDIDKYLHYIIRFQNTGTASAINVRVEHILDSKLDWTTMQLQSMSHAGRVEITDGSNVEFIFDNINLIDSTTDEPNSHGYIAFRIKPKSDVVFGDIISGTADIYFDFNPPIITNTVNTEIVNRLSVEEFEENIISIYPNPTKGLFTIRANREIEKLTIYDINGRQLKAIEVKNSLRQYQLNISNLSKGIYFVKIQTNLGTQTQKISKQ